MITTTPPDHVPDEADTSHNRPTKRRFLEPHQSATTRSWSEDDADMASPSNSNTHFRSPANIIPTAHTELTSPARGEDIELPVDKTARRHSIGSKKRHFWTDQEVQWLLAGVSRFGTGKWARILEEYDFPELRTSVHLKDKYRNLLLLQAKQLDELEGGPHAGMEGEQDGIDDDDDDDDDVEDQNELATQSKEKKRRRRAKQTGHTRAKRSP